MSPVSPWIAALADQCLSFYLGQNDQDEFQVEDIGGSLSFSIRKPALRTAVVVSWEQGENRHCATFTDSKNQIDAIILCDSPDAQGDTSPCPPSIKGGPRHLVELSDIKLIFTYSASNPDVYLQVKRFTIRPNAVSRGDVPKPKLKKSLRTLMTMTCEKIQKNQAHVGSNGQTDAGLTDSFDSQRDPNIPTNDSQNKVSQLLFSQPPSHMRQGAPKGNPMTDRVSLKGSSDLLGLLAPYNQIQTNDTAPRERRGAHRPSLGESGRESRHSPFPNERNRSATASLERDVDDLIEECRLRASQPPNESDDHDRVHTVGTGDNQQFSKKRHRGSTDPPSQAAPDDDLGSQGRQSPNTSPSKKRQRIDAGGAMLADQTESEQVRNKPVPSFPRVQIVTTKTDIMPLSATNPWEGMVKIPLSEIDIPKDQKELLEELKFIPQDPGVSAPLCHVPPHLLTQWNNIARKRQHLTKEGEGGGGEGVEGEGEGEEGEGEEGAEEEQVSDRGHTPTPQDAFTSPLSWSPSPIRTPARDVLPRDTVSPEVYRRPTRRIPTPSSTQYIVDQPTEDGDVGMVNGSPRALSQPGQGVIVSSKRVIETVEQQCSPSPEVTGPVNPLSLECDLGNDPFPKPNASKSLHGPQRVTQEHCHDEQTAENPPFKPEVCDESSVDESDDEPEMETTVPFPLGGSLPISSQPEQELTSSGPSLPSLAGGTIQVVETPAVHITHPNSNKQSKQRAGFQAPSSQQPYSQAAKTSPSSRILDTYRSQDSHGQSDLSQEASNPSLPILADESLRLDVLGTQTQTSSVHAPSQATVQSSSDVVLDSSRPAQRQRGSSIFHLGPSDDPSSFPYPRRHSLSVSQLHESSHDSSRGLFSLDGASHMQDLSPMESTTWVAAHRESPSKRSRRLRRGSADTGQKATHSPNAELVARREGFIGKSDKYAEAQTIYEKFCNDYSPYSGDFPHFTEMCSKLQAMRQKGQLQRSFLWDDFVIQHLEEYPRYLAECSSQESGKLDYEDFFCSKFSRPRHKKRSLTAHGVDIVASQFVPTTRLELGNPPVPQQVTIQGEVTQDKAAQSEVANTSFTASLVEKLSNLHARSFGDVPVPDANMPATTQSSPSPSARTRPDSVELKVEADDSFNETIPKNISSSNDHKLVLSNDDEEMIDATQYDADDIRISFNPNDVDKAETGMDEIEETQEADDTHHETASIELGDETDDRHISSPASPSPAPPAPPVPLGSLNNAELERPRQRRPWFRSLRNIFPNRSYQNVLQELRRRGGARVLVDEKGVIRRPTYNQQKNPDT
ncbi:hypothetical protein N7497_007422 [Penicillium chrysogenum]|nr:hypothetical protein N7497_007422 [Penicillium chrysogenum]